MNEADLHHFHWAINYIEKECGPQVKTTKARTLSIQPYTHVCSHVTLFNKVNTWQLAHVLQFRMHQQEKKAAATTSKPSEFTYGLRENGLRSHAYQASLNTNQHPRLQKKTIQSISKERTKYNLISIYYLISSQRFLLPSTEVRCNSDFPLKSTQNPSILQHFITCAVRTGDYFLIPFCLVALVQHNSWMRSNIAAQ